MEVQIMNNFTNIVFMKYGMHAGEAPDDIVKRKIEELENCGKMYWGYNGTLIDPVNQVQPFAKGVSGKVYLLLSYTGSEFENSSESAKEFSTDKKEWNPLPEKADVRGSEKALVCKTLEKVEGMEINLFDYFGVVGTSKNKPLGNYIKNHTDKVCAVYKGGSTETMMAKIDFVCELDSQMPAVYIR